MPWTFQPFLTKYNTFFWFCTRLQKESTAVLLVGPKCSNGVEAQESQDNSTSSLLKVEGLPVGVSDRVLEEAEGVLDESSLISAVDCLLGHLRSNNIAHSEFLELPVVSFSEGSPDHLQSFTLVGSVVVEIVLTKGSGFGICIGLVVMSQPQIISLHLLVLGSHSKSQIKYITMSHHQEFQSKHSIDPTPRISPQPLIRAKGPTSKIFDVDGLKPEYAPKQQESRFQSSSQMDHLPHSRIVSTSVLEVRENYHMKSPYGSDLQAQLNKLREENQSLKQQLQEALQSMEHSMVQSQFAQNENEINDITMKQIQQKLSLFDQERHEQHQEIHKLKEQTQEQKDIIELQQMQIEGLLMEKTSLQNSVNSNKKIVAFKDQHIESLMTKMKKIQEQHKEEISQLHSENEFLHKAHLELISERTTLSSTLTDAQNEAMFHQSFAEKHHAKRREVEERSREQFQALQDEIEQLKEQLRTSQR